MITKNQVKYIQSLGQKKWRDAENEFIAEGPKLVNELLAAANCRVTKVYAVKGWIDGNSPGDAEVVEISETDLNKISQLSTPNQVLAVARKLNWSGDPVISGNISLALDTIQDPGNMGTIVRVADWFG